jgi:hypothetical protein
MLNLLFAANDFLNDNILGVPYRWLLHYVQRWLRSLIIIVVLLLAVALGYSASLRFIGLVVLGLLMGIGTILLFIRWPPLGLMALIGTIVIPYSGPSNFNASMVVATLLLGLWLFNMLVRQREIKLITAHPIGPSLALVLTAILAFGVGQLPWYTFASHAPLGAQLGGLSLFVLSTGVFLLTAHQVREVKWLAWLTWLFLSLGGLYIAGRLVPGLDKFLLPPFGDSATGSLFWTWLVALSFSQAVFNRNLPLGGRFILGGLLISTLYVALTQGWAWNSGWMPPLVAMFFILLAAKPRLSLPAVFLGFIEAFIKSQKLISTIMVGDNDYSLSTRLEAWRIRPGELLLVYPPLPDSGLGGAI